MLFVTNFSKPHHYLFVVGFILPLASIELSTGVNLYWQMIVGPVSLALLLLCPYRGRRLVPIPRFARFLVYALVLSLVWMLVDYMMLERHLFAHQAGLGKAQSIYRMPVQVISFLFQTSILLIIPTRAHTKKDVFAAFKGYGLALIISAVTGVILLLLTGSGMFTESVGQAGWNIGSTRLSRIGGLSSEPRHLGAYTVVFLGFLLGYYTLGKRRISLKTLLTLGIYLLILFVTFSTSSWLGFFAMLSVYLIFLLPKMRSTGVQFIILTVALVVAIGTSSSFVQSAYEARVESRLSGGMESHGIQSQKDYYAVQVFSEKPHHLVFGFGLGGFDLEALPYLLDRPWIGTIHTPTPTSTGVQMLVSFGLLGCLLLVSMCWKWNRRLKRQRFSGIAHGIILAITGLAFVSGIAWPAFMFFAGGALTIGHISQSRRSVGGVPTLTA